LPTGALSAFTDLQSLTITGTSAIGDQMGSSLEQLTAADVAAQKMTLSYVDLSYNLLTTVPSAALATLSNLTSVDLRGNKLAAIDSRAFASINSTAGVRSLDLSHNAITVLDRDAFGALKPTLLYLTMAYSQLKDPSLEAIRKLKALVTLNVEGNEITNVDLLIGQLSRVQYCDNFNVAVAQQFF
jgi:Leucine-rich repeat (LRR) protein